MRKDDYDGIEPKVGLYDEDPIITDGITRHIDEMTGHGIPRLASDYSGWPIEQDRVEALLNSPPIDSEIRRAVPDEDAVHPEHEPNAIDLIASETVTQTPPRVRIRR